ncbi:MAG: DNA-binding protein [Candidatus Thermoplasmatota archaeon]
MDEELEALRRKKLQELQAQRAQQLAAEEEEKAIESQKQLILRKVLEPEARERLGRLKTAYPDVAKAVENQLILLAETGKLDQKIDDETLCQILSKIVPRKREIRIDRR